MKRLAAGAVVCLATILTALAWGGSAKTALVSKTSGGDPADGDSGAPAVSESGRYIAFESAAANLPGGSTQIYVHDRKRGKTKVVSKNSAGEIAETGGSEPSISNSGRYVTFFSGADNLPDGDVGGEAYVHDLKTGKTKLVSKTSDGDPATDTIDRPDISASGRHVCFTSEDDNFPGADSTADIYLHDRETGKTTLVSKTSQGDPGDADSGGCSVSESGRYVGFASSADNLAGNDSFQDVYVHDRKTGETNLASHVGIIPANGDSNQPSLSASGKEVAYRSDAPNLPGDDSTFSVYVHKVGTRTSKLISKTSGGEPADALSTAPSISASGRYVAFASVADNLPGGASGNTQIYLHDRRSGKTKLISQTKDGDPPEGGGFEPSIAAGAGFVGYEANSNDLPGLDGTGDVYLRGPL